MSRMMFVNIAVADPAKSREFFTGLGFEYDDQMSTDDVQMLKVNDQTFVMQHSPEHFKGFLPGTKAADPTKHTEVLIAVSASSREEVDELCDGAIDAGATNARDAEDHGYMYGRSWRDLDGHVWEVVWMDLQAAGIDQG